MLDVEVNFPLTRAQVEPLSPYDVRPPFLVSFLFYLAADSLSAICHPLVSSIKLGSKT